LKHVTPVDKNCQPVSVDKIDEMLAAKLIVYAGEPEQYTSFITPEAYNALQEWIDYRKENGEIIGSESWVMRHNWAFKYRLGADQPEQLSIHGVKKLLNRALWEQGLRKPLDGSRRHEFKESHGFRKFFKTRAEHAGMKPINVEIIMGHKVGISDHYYRPREQELLEDYLKAVDNLTINKQTSDLAAQISASDKEIQNLHAQLEQSEKETQIIKVQMVRMQDQAQLKARSLEDDIKSMREDMKNMFEVLRKAKQNDGRVGKDKTVLDENRRITFYEDYADGQTRSVSIPIDSVKVDE
jgi:hypothetical protein